VHKYLKSIGFHGIDSEDLKLLKCDIQAHPDMQSFTVSDGESGTLEFRKEYSFHTGITIKGFQDYEDGFQEEYYYPYFEGTAISTNEDVEIVKTSDRDSYQGIVDDPRLGIDLVFYIIDDIALVHEDYKVKDLVNHGGVKLSGLASEGVVLLPLEDSLKPKVDLETANRIYEIKKSAKEGDQDAIERLSYEDLTQYNEISERIENEDVLTILSSFFMPQGIECDKYTVLGEIVKRKKFLNEATRQAIYVLTLNSNEILLDIVINEKDLMGEPEVGRRLRADIWLQGKIS
jgi:hypothetical protein